MCLCWDHSSILVLIQEAEISELEEKIKTLVEEREAKLTSGKELKQILQQCLEQSRQIENEVEKVASKMEEVKVGCPLLCNLFKRV